MGSKTLARARIGESITSIGTGNAILGGALFGYAAFSSIPGIASGDAVNYLLKANNGQWEVGEGFYIVPVLPALPYILRQNPREGSSGDGVLVNFSVSPEVFLTMTSKSSRTYGSYSRAYVGVNQAVAAATDVVVQFNTLDWGFMGYARAASYWNASLFKQESFNEKGYWNIRAKVDALATFAGDSYLALFKNGLEVARGPTLTDAKSLALDADVLLSLDTDGATVVIRSVTGGTILAGATRSYVHSRWMHTGAD